MGRKVVYVAPPRSSTPASVPTPTALSSEAARAAAIAERSARAETLRLAAETKARVRQQEQHADESPAYRRAKSASSGFLIPADITTERILAVFAQLESRAAAGKLVHDAAVAMLHLTGMHFRMLIKDNLAKRTLGLADVALASLVLRRTTSAQGAMLASKEGLKDEPLLDSGSLADSAGWHVESGGSGSHASLVLGMFGHTDSMGSVGVLGQEHTGTPFKIGPERANELTYENVAELMEFGYSFVPTDNMVALMQALAYANKGTPAAYNLLAKFSASLHLKAKSGTPVVVQPRPFVEPTVSMAFSGMKRLYPVLGNMLFRGFAATTAGGLRKARADAVKAAAASAAAELSESAGSGSDDEDNHTHIINEMAAFSSTPDVADIAGGGMTTSRQPSGAAPWANIGTGTRVPAGFRRAAGLTSFSMGSTKALLGTFTGRRTGR